MRTALDFFDFQGEYFSFYDKKSLSLSNCLMVDFTYYWGIFS
jgi:hypothetical protein